MLNPVAARLRALNCQFAEIIQRAKQRGGGPSEKILELEEIQVLSDLVDQGKQLLEDSLSESDPEWQTQRKAYQENLREIKDLIQKLESNLNRRREELRAESTQLRAITDWIEALKRTR